MTVLLRSTVGLYLVSRARSATSFGHVNRESLCSTIMQKMRRILVIGSGGAGKSTVALELGKRLALPVIHLDALYWRPGWLESPTHEWQQIVEGLLTEDRWIIDGNYGGTLDLRLSAADTVVFLDLPRWLCLWRVIKRRLRFHGQSRPDMAAGCPERLTGEFLRWIWFYPKRRREGILERLRHVAQEKEVVVLHSPREVRYFLEGLSAGTA